MQQKWVKMWKKVEIFKEKKYFTFFFSHFFFHISFFFKLFFKKLLNAPLKKFRECTVRLTGIIWYINWKKIHINYIHVIVHYRRSKSTDQRGVSFSFNWTVKLMTHARHCEINNTVKLTVHDIVCLSICQQAQHMPRPFLCVAALQLSM